MAGGGTWLKNTALNYISVPVLDMSEVSICNKKDEITWAMTKGSMS